jgi:hypothetical protein
LAPVRNPGRAETACHDSFEHSVCYHYPQIVEKIKARGDDVRGHGRTNAELLRPMW